MVLGIYVENRCIFDLGVRLRMEKLDSIKHNVYKDENNYLASKGIRSSKVLKLRGFIFKQKYRDRHG